MDDEWWWSSHIWVSIIPYKTINMNIHLSANNRGFEYCSDGGTYPKFYGSHDEAWCCFWTNPDVSCFDLDSPKSLCKASHKTTINSMVDLVKPPNPSTIKPVHIWFLLNCASQKANANKQQERKDIVKGVKIEHAMLSLCNDERNVCKCVLDIFRRCSAQVWMCACRLWQRLLPCWGLGWQTANKCPIHWFWLKFRH